MRPPLPARPLPALSGIERTLGDVLYQLDLTRAAHELTRAQIATLRAIGLRASAWLAGPGAGRLSDAQAAEGIARFDALAKAATDFLAGTADARTVLGTRDRLAALVDLVPAG